ncbi:ribosomal-protein-alanine acetyltransferase [Oceanospirillum multiglobuliferum]|uniref:N-acetyltransferase domain-containing protein n=1 Tax=Oceanospirillum multiglobuliferum TaxID=64969 RepID=A0A1T4PIV4_9GAMM|nr:GNAT family N-acetyltransferase/peptidase C39 family protein [Oceanospirillum multiglobuliferum]OPX55539.1 hypothetical protein BTE48_07905 [Oceanospirillum multiglobuliferum]SJZ91126.1 ribosomal-protein-alanine acetyltransferase [Oceanospirillum multiglobuliferum]
MHSSAVVEPVQSASILIRIASAHDLKALLQLELLCFQTDRLSKRSFKHFLAAPSAKLVVAEVDGKIQAYGLLLFRQGTHLARLYSIAVDPAAQGKGIARQLMAYLEEQATEQGCVYLRLEVRADNQAAIALYQQRGYRKFGQIPEYYEDGALALRMEKRLSRQVAATPTNMPYHGQNTEFTCGPSALLMAMKSLDKQIQMTLEEELQIWREATTIFMMSGHGGCSPHGLALSAAKRGFAVELYVNTEQVPFIESVRDEQKKQIIEAVHQNFLDQIAQTDIALHQEDLTPERLKAHLEQGASILSLISTWRFNRNKVPHWVTITRADERYVYMSDPEADTDLMHTATDNIAVPILLEEFAGIACFGRQRLRCTLVLSNQ